MFMFISGEILQIIRQLSSKMIVNVENESVKLICIAVMFLCLYNAKNTDDWFIQLTKKGKITVNFKITNLNKKILIL